MATIPAEIDEAIQGPEMGEEDVQSLDVKEEDVQGSFYKPLRDVDEIRLLHLWTSGEEDIVCTLRHATFSEQPKYEALSYMWGAQNVVRTILINGVPVQVRWNLWCALHHLRQTSKTRVLWIDALCIHQQNIHERNHQVSQMGRIYNRASRVVVWLGPSDAASKAFFGLFSRRWCTYLTTPHDPIRVAEESTELAAISSVFSRPYWKRLWIIQEFLMAKEFEIQCGKDICSSAWLCWFAGQFGNISTKPRAHPGASITAVVARSHTLGALGRSMPIRLIRQRLGLVDFGNPKSANATLFQLFSDYKDADCIDQRDQIFGLHSLASICCKEANTIDYSITWAAALSRLLHHQLYSHHSLPKWVESALPYSPAKGSLVAEIRNFFHEAKALLNGPSGYPAYQDVMKCCKCLAPAELIGPLYFNGYSRGRVCYVSPSLNQGFSKDCSPLPELSTRLKLHIQYISSLRVDPESSPPYATIETDLVGAVSGSEQPNVSFPESAHQPTGPSDLRLTSKPVEYWGETHTTVLEIDESTLDKKFRDLLSDAQKCSAGDHVLAFEENGLIFFAPKETKVGDLVCQFRGSDVLAIFPSKTLIESLNEPSAGEWAPVDMLRAVNFLAAHSNVAADICGTSMGFDTIGARQNQILISAQPRVVKNLCRA